MTPDEVTALATSIGVASGIVAVGFAGWQLSQVKRQMKLSNLTNVLSIESEINDRKEVVDAVTLEISQSGKLKKKEARLLEEKLESAVENWINSVDRLCFCIKKGYFPEKEWSIEYRDYIINIVKGNESKFGSGSRYVHIIDLNNKWKRKMVN